jgi:hypothetical protein
MSTSDANRLNMPDEPSSFRFVTQTVRCPKCSTPVFCPDTGVCFCSRCGEQFMFPPAISSEDEELWD